MTEVGSAAGLVDATVRKQIGMNYPPNLHAHAHTRTGLHKYYGAFGEVEGQPVETRTFLPQSGLLS